jgi:hypothetical protein
MISIRQKPKWHLESEKDGDGTAADQKRHGYGTYPFVPGVSESSADLLRPRL